MTHVILRGGEHPESIGAALSALRLALGPGDRVDVLTTPAVDAMARACARDCSIVHLHASTPSPSWTAIAAIAQHAGTDHVIVADAGVAITADHLLGLVARARVAHGIGMVAPLLLDRDGLVVEAGRLACSDGQVVSLGAGDDPAGADYSADRHVDGCADTIVAMSRSSLDLLAQASVSDTAASGAGPSEVLWAAHRPVIVSGAIHATIAHASAAPSVLAPARLRRLSDRRHRCGRQVLIAVADLASARRHGVVDRAVHLASSGSHVTIAVLRAAPADARSRWQQSEAGRAGVLLALLEGNGTDEASRGIRFRDLLARRHYDAALLWSPASGRWCLPRLHRHSPATRVLARLPEGWQTRLQDGLLDQVRRRWLSAEAFDRIVAAA